MALGFLNISHNFAGNTFNYLIVEWVKSTAQATPVVGHVTGTGLGGQNDTDATEVNYPAPYVNQQLQVINLPEVWHLVRFWSSTDGVTKDTLLLELAGNARTGALYPINRYEYVVGRGYDNTTPVVTEGVWSDPVQDDQGIRDTRLLNANYWVEERGTGSLLAAEIIDRSDLGGGFDFSNINKYMENGGVYVVYAITRVDLPGDDSGSGISENNDIYVLNANEDYNPVTMGGRTIIANFSTQVGTLTMPNLALLADSRFILQTHGGLQRNVVMQFDVGDTIRFMGADVNKITLGGGEEIEIVILDNVAYVIAHSTNHARLGQVVWGYKQIINSLPADGTLLALANYPRVAELINSLAASSVVNEVTWQTSSTAADGQTVYANKGKFMSDGTNFRTPDLRSKSLKAVSAVDGSIVFGRYEHQELMNHTHGLRGGFTYGGYDGGGNAFWRIRNNTDPINNTDPAIEATGATDQKVNNVGLIPLICI